ncbi:MAG: hypothetical protein ABI478_12175 [Propionivibrio sp.]
MLRIADFPQLKLIAWNRGENALIEDEEALALYERNWRFVEQDRLGQQERELIDRLVKMYGHGVLNV